MAVAVIRGARGVLVGRRIDGIPPWVFIGGKVEPDETASQAAVREAAEEAGARGVAVGEIGRRVHPRTGRLMVYIDCRAIGDDVRVAAPEELTEVRWVNLAELAGLMPDFVRPGPGTPGHDLRVDTARPGFSATVGTWPGVRRPAAASRPTPRPTP